MAATYKGILTNNGKALIASATLNNKINYSHIAVGDGNGSVPTPLETRTALVNEKARIALNVVEINPNNTNQIVCEAIIPTTTGGFYIRELGLFAGSTMVVNANYPPTYKPLADEGGAREIALKLVINIQNADVIALYLDDSLIYATRAWIDTNYIRRNELVDNLTTSDATKPLTAKQGKALQDYKLDKTETAVAATKLAIARSVSFSGAATGSYSYDGSGNSSCILTLANSGVSANTYGSALKIPVITVNAKGLVTVVSEQNLQIVDNLTTDDSAKPVSAKQAKALQDNKLDKNTEASTDIAGIVKLVNDLTTGGTDKALTAEQGKLLLAGLTFSTTENGYLKLPNWMGGLIIQWGTISLVASSGGTLIQPVVYPITFPNVVLHIFPSLRESSGSNADSIYTQDRTATGFKIGQTAGEAHTASWFAIGY
ncbi:phage tail protein [Acinetobacter sp. ANC 4173]|uniref:phage tail protein n=1 Tax=Acinetobacter sp. ANC 4173 TaxID=2529837 RepID=UPI00103D774F|nr:phage tail protein [Acinetobacter sp. ANC 4173]TCB81652.1 hypothetical protein E0H94_03795 [Acinetobacter sp. ANC 4173]